MHTVIRLAPLCVALAVALQSSTAEATSVAVIGDSLADGGNSAQLEYTWVDMIAEDPPLGVEIDNFAVRGTQAVEWAAPGNPFFATVQAAVAAQGPYDVVIIGLGGNDFQVGIADGAFTFAERVAIWVNLDTIVSNTEALMPDAEIILMNYYDMFDRQSYLLPPGLVMAPYVSEQLQPASGFMCTIFNGPCIFGSLNYLIGSVAGSHGADVVDVYSAFLDHGYIAHTLGINPIHPPYFLAAGLQGNVVTGFDVHPATAGHVRISELVEAKL